jgi:membrane-bound lytic murein transglycosylase B
MRTLPAMHSDLTFRRRALLAAFAAAALIPTERLAAAPVRPGRAQAQRRRVPAQREGQAYGLTPAIVAFAADVSERRGIPNGWLRAQLVQARRLPAVQRLVMPPPVGVPKNWAAYRARFIDGERTAAGLAFWREHAAVLAQAESQYGVPAALIVAIIGIETYYGRIVGNFRVLDALATLSFDFPSGRSDRSGFFREELEAFFVWTHRESLDPAAVRGSFAGALGLPQFMPGSLLRHAVDYDGDAHVDLRGSVADAVGSVAHFLVNHGWQPGLAVQVPVQPPADEAALKTLLAPDIEPTFSAAQMVALGVNLPGETSGPGRPFGTGPLALAMLENGGDKPPTYVAATKNFWVITRYNRSSYYALAVAEFAEHLARERGLSAPASTPSAVPAVSAAPAPTALPPAPGR